MPPSSTLDPTAEVKALLRRDRSATDLALSVCSARRCLEQHCNVVKLAANLLGPVGLALARAEEQLPGPHGMPGGARFELKWDGFRAGVVRRDGEIRLWSRNGTDFTAKFPDVKEALEAQLTTDCVLDGVI